MKFKLFSLFLLTLLEFVIHSCSDDSQSRNIRANPQIHKKLNAQKYHNLIDSFPTGEIDQITISSDGKRIAFRQNGIIYFLNEEGRIVQKVFFNDDKYELVDIQFEIEKVDMRVLFYKHNKTCHEEGCFTESTIHTANLKINGDLVYEKEILRKVYDQYIVHNNIIIEIGSGMNYDLNGQEILEVSGGNIQFYYIPSENRLIQSSNSSVKLHTIDKHNPLKVGGMIEIQGNDVIEFKSLRDNHTASITSLQYYSPKKYVISGSKDKTIKVWNSDGTLYKTLRGSNTPITKLMLIGANIISINEGKEIFVWDFENEKILNKYSIPDMIPSKSTISESGILLTLLSSGGLQKISLSDTKNEQLGKEYLLPISLFRYLPSHQFLIYSTPENTKLFDIKTNTFLKHDLPPNLRHIQISSDEKLLTLAIHHDTDLYIFNPEKLKSQKVKVPDSIHNLILYKDDKTLYVQGIQYESNMYGKHGHVYRHELGKKGFDMLPFKARELYISNDQNLFLGNIGKLHSTSALYYNFMIFENLSKVYDQQSGPKGVFVSKKGSVAAYGRWNDGDHRDYLDLIHLDSMKTLDRISDDMQFIEIREDDKGFLYSQSDEVYYKNISSGETLKVINKDQLKDFAFLTKDILYSRNSSNTPVLKEIFGDAKTELYFFKDNFLAINEKGEYFFSDDSLKNKINTVNSLSFEMVDSGQSPLKINSAMLKDFFHVEDEKKESVEEKSE